MRTRFASVGILGAAALVFSLGGCAGSSSGTGTAGATGSTAGAQGSTAGQTGSTAGQTGSTAGEQGSTAGAQSSTAGQTGSTAGAQGSTAGAQGGTAGAQGTAGSTAGASGTAGATGTGGAGMTGAGGTGAIIPSTGCGNPPRGADKSTGFVKKDIAVTGVDMAFINKYPMNNGTTYSWTKRNYFIRLPANYSPTKAYPVDMAGTGCGGGETTGSTGDYTLPPLPTGSNSQTESIQIGLSYAESSAANPSCIAFTDDYVNSPEVQYIAAVVADISANYCVSTTQVFANGYSSGAFEAVTAEISNPDKLRGAGIQIGGGLRINHAPIMNKPIAMMFIVGTQDQGNPIGPLATVANDTNGSVVARDEVLHRNGCVAADFQIVDTCATAAMRAANPPETPLPCTAGVADGDTFGNVPHRCGT